MGKCIEYSHSKPSIPKKNDQQLGFPGMGCTTAGDAVTLSLSAIWLCWGWESCVSLGCLMTSYFLFNVGVKGMVRILNQLPANLRIIKVGKFH